MSKEKSQLQPVELSVTISTQPAGAIEKACRVLKAMSDRRNIRLTDIAAHCGFEKSTTGRILDLLMAEGMVVRHPITKCYGFGPEVARISRGVGEALDWHAVTHASLDRIAAEFGDTAIMSLLSGLELVCVDLQAGHYPIRAQYQDIGSRRTVGAGVQWTSSLGGPRPE